MTWYAAGLWGLAGGVAIELIDLYKLVRTSDGSYEVPEMSQTFWQAYAIAVVIRLLLGFGAAYALYNSGQISTALAAVGSGAGATGFFEHVSRSSRPSSQEVSTR
jgi:hypothetical protein